MIDCGRVNELRNEVGPLEFDEVVEIFVEEVEEIIGKLRSGATASLAADAHFLKGSALNLGFAELAAVCTATEAAAACGKAAGPQTIVACYDTSKAEFLAGLRDGARAA